MQPQKAGKIINTIGMRVPGNPTYAQRVSVHEVTPDGGKFEHAGYGRPPGMAEDTEPGDLILVTTREKPKLRERFQKEVDPARATARALGALAEMGYLHAEGDTASAIVDSSDPQLELVREDGAGPVAFYDEDIGRVVTTMVFKDHNPQK